MHFFQTSNFEIPLEPEFVYELAPEFSDGSETFDHETTGTDSEKYQKAIEAIWKELKLKFRADDAEGLYARRQRLRIAFRSVPSSFAKTLYYRLGERPTGDSLSKLFHYQLATATRQEMLSILKAKMNVPKPVTVPPVKPSQPQQPLVMPLHEIVKRCLKLLDNQKIIGYQLASEPSKRLRCVLTKMLQSGVDDRFITFQSLYGYLDLQTKTPTWNLLIRRLSNSFLNFSPNSRDKYILTSLELLDDGIFKGISFLQLQYVNLMGAMSPAMVQIKDWIAARQRDPKSIYSCYR